MKFLKILLVVTFFTSMLSAAKKEPIGKVIAVTGKCEANKRPLSRGSDIFVSDLIKVAAKAKIQVRFSDGGLLNLIELTEYRINTYQYNKTGNDNFTANLIKGGFRELTGEIGKQNPKGVSVKTPVATIGIRGTTFQANMKNGEVFFGVDSGSITISNDAGERTLNPGEFVSAFSTDELGLVSNVRPEALNLEFFEEPEGGDSIEEEMEADDFPEDDLDDEDLGDEDLDDEDLGDEDLDDEDLGDEDLEDEDLDDENLDFEEDLGDEDLGEEDFNGELGEGDLTGEELGEDDFNVNIGADDFGDGDLLGEGIGDDFGGIDDDFELGEDDFFELPEDQGNPSC